MSLKQRTIRGLSWAMIDKFFTQFVKFGIGITLARLLSPYEFGLTGILAIFIALSDAFVISGFSEALIRRTDVKEKDYDTVFLYNIVVSILCYAVLFLFSDYIGLFFEEPLLSELILVLGLAILANGLGVVSRAKLIKKLDFKSIAKTSFLSSIISGTVAIILAVKGYGVWSLAWKLVIESTIRSVMYNIYGKHWFSAGFNYESFKEMFGFGSNLLLSDILNTAFVNAYKVVIGKFFGSVDLGLFVKANNYKDLPSKTINKTVAIVSYPALAELKDDRKRLKNAYRRLIESTMFITFVLMFSLVASAENFILGLIGPQWAEAIPMLQLLCFAGMFYPLHALNLNMLKVKGRSDLFLRLSLLVKVIMVPVILIGIYFGIKALIISMIFAEALAYYFNSYWSGKMVGYSFKDQVADIAPSFFLGLLIGSAVFLAGYLIDLPPLAGLLVQAATGACLTMLVSDFLKVKPYLEMKEIVIGQLTKLKFKKVKV